jgi:hypothetical protein
MTRLENKERTAKNWRNPFFRPRKKLAAINTRAMVYLLVRQLSRFYESDIKNRSPAPKAAWQKNKK